jgi:2-keto-4-pentenoate hydratase/2-oxohepta-3-ene-1,7-dioic acid hydratase in catechol pathway
MKATSAITGPNDDVIIPKNSEKTDWEVELGVVIGSVARYVSEADAMKHVAGYCLINDVSERAFQTERHGQWTKGKSCDSFGPIGPWLVTADEVPDPQDLAMFCDINGKRFQNGSTKTMVYGVRYLVSYLSQFMSLQPGDIISTGTPAGCRHGPEAAALSEGRRQNPSRHRRSGRAAPDCAKLQRLGFLFRSVRVLCARPTGRRLPRRRGAGSVPPRHSR